MKRTQPQTQNTNSNSIPTKKFHYSQKSQTYKSKRKPQYILNKKLADQKESMGNAFIHKIQQKQFYFPYQSLNKPQQNFIGSMFSCLDNGKHLLIQSPTGTGKTLSLLVSALSWSDQNYHSKQGGTYQNRIKVIYSSRAHSQLSQIAKELEKTPYRPHMLLFGSRQKMCINQQLQKQMSSNQQKSYNEWSHKCNLAVRFQERYEDSPMSYQRDIEENEKTVRFLRSKSVLTQIQKLQLQKTEEYLRQAKLKCPHYHSYNKGLDKKFYDDVGRTVLNSEKLKQLAQERKPQTVCPYFYPKRVKNLATLYLMPYNYLLDSRILQYSAGFLKDSIIIFDEGHNVPATACQGYSISFSQHILISAKRNITQKLLPQDYDADENEMQNLMKLQEEAEHQPEEDKEMNGLAKLVRKRNDEKQLIKEGGETKLKFNVDFLCTVISNAESNYRDYFQQQRMDFKKVDYSFLQAFNSSNDQKKTYWQAVRFANTSDRHQIERYIEKIFFSQRIHEFMNKTLEQRLKQVVEALRFVVKYFIKKDKKCFKIVNLVRFYERLSNLLYNQDYSDKFFVEITQSRKYLASDKKNIYKGEIEIRCLAPEFSFKQLEKIKPHNIIITSGTLSPLNVFAKEIGLQFVQVQVGHVITKQNIIVRKVGRNLDGELLKVDSVFYSGKNGLQFANLTGLFNLLIKTLEVIPHGVLVIVSSFSCLKHLENFYKHERSRDIRKRLQEVKPHVYFQPKRNLELVMQRFNEKSQYGKGALLFCVCRAKLSEGIDFKDRLCRSVIFFGIPYVNKGDTFICQKGQYLKKMKSPYASDWKFIEASKAINQGLGRAVRHANDYGSILLLDNRYDETNKDSVPVVANISKWITDDWKVNNNIQELQKELKQFYERCETKFPLLEKIQTKIEEGQTVLSSYFKNKW